MEAIMEESEPPFTTDIIQARLSDRFCLPQITSFSRNTNPSEHIESFRGKKRLKVPAYLLHVIQKDDKLLKDYIKRLNLKALQVQKHLEELALTAIMRGLRDCEFLFSLDKNPPTTMAKLLNRLQKYANVEEACVLREAVQNKAPPTKEQQMRAELSSTARNRKRKDNQSHDNHQPNKWPDSKFKMYTPLNKMPKQVLMEIQDKRILTWPSKLKSDPNGRSKNKYYYFHWDHGHLTRDCLDLKQEIEALIHSGHLKEYVSYQEK
ncbi:uncharacterized protein LOC131247020 [Magnolia sinica]|uniref:uncharacterized protein LOC131247020 n=1 Tax=Magnolia sinica TaxID=86752 RepID=UPI00265AC045|nr:uncharacterized protein LOC131247020 [Magnolia sinica]